jgi:hypothetical protein
MNVLIVDPSVLPDIGCQQRIVQQFSGAANISIRFATGILQAAWQARDFSPDAIVFDWIGDCGQLGKLIAMLHRINPHVVIFHLDAGSFVATENPCNAPIGSAMPEWLRSLASSIGFAARVAHDDFRIRAMGEEP